MLDDSKVYQLPVKKLDDLKGSWLALSMEV